jgi:hypothetical protein
METFQASKRSNGVMRTIHFKSLQVPLLAILLSTPLTASAQKTRTLTFNDSFHEFAGPQAYRDAHSGTVFYVESDGRHVAAISKRGKLLWVRDPFEDAQLEPYRTENAQIISIGEATWWGEGPPLRKFRGWVIITYNSSQFGGLNPSNGDFVFLGQN